MCYLVAKDINKRGCVAFKTRLGPDLVSLKKELISMIGLERIQRKQLPE